MYSETIKPKVDTMFNDLRKKVFSLVSTSSVSNETINKVAKTVSSELATRSKSILSDMLFELSDSLLISLLRPPPLIIRKRRKPSKH